MVGLELLWEDFFFTHLSLPNPIITSSLQEEEVPHRLPQKMGLSLSLSLFFFQRGHNSISPTLKDEGRGPREREKEEVKNVYLVRAQ